VYSNLERRRAKKYNEKTPEELVNDLKGFGSRVPEVISMLKTIRHDQRKFYDLLDATFYRKIAHWMVHLVNNEGMTLHEFLHESLSEDFASSTFHLLFSHGLDHAHEKFDLALQMSVHSQVFILRRKFLDTIYDRSGPVKHTGEFKKADKDLRCLIFFVCAKFSSKNFQAIILALRNFEVQTQNLEVQRDIHRSSEFDNMQVPSQTSWFCTSMQKVPFPTCLSGNTTYQTNRDDFNDSICGDDSSDDDAAYLCGVEVAKLLTMSVQSVQHEAQEPMVQHMPVYASS
jgi:hypothetical protein